MRDRGSGLLELLEDEDHAFLDGELGEVFELTAVEKDAGALAAGVHVDVFLLWIDDLDEGRAVAGAADLTRDPRLSAGGVDLSVDFPRGTLDAHEAIEFVGIEPHAATGGAAIDVEISLEADLFHDLAVVGAVDFGIVGLTGGS